MKRFLATFLATVLLVTAIPWTLSADGYGTGSGGPVPSGGSASEGWNITGKMKVWGTKLSIISFTKDEYMQGKATQENMAFKTEGTIFIVGDSTVPRDKIPYFVGSNGGTNYLEDKALNLGDIRGILSNLSVPEDVSLSLDIVSKNICDAYSINWNSGVLAGNHIESTLGLTGSTDNPTENDKFIIYCLTYLIAIKNGGTAMSIIDGTSADKDYVILEEPLIAVDDVQENFSFVVTPMEYARYIMGYAPSKPALDLISKDAPTSKSNPGYLWVRNAILGQHLINKEGQKYYSPTWNDGKSNSYSSRIYYKDKRSDAENDYATFDDNYHGWGTLFINPYLKEMCGIGSYASVSIGSYSKDITPLTTWLKTKVPIQQDILNYQSATLHGPMPGQLLSSMTSETVFNLDALNDLMPELDDVTKVASGSSIILHDEELLVLAGESYQDVPSSRNTLENTQKLTYGGIIKMEIDGEFFHGKETTIFHEAMKTTQADIKAHPNNYYKDGTALANSLSLKQVYGGNFKVLDQTKVSNKLMSSMVAYAGNNEILKNMTENLSIGTLESAGLASRQNNEVYINMVIEALTGDDLALTYKYFNNESAFGSLASIASTDKYAPDKSGIELPVVKGKAEFQHSAALYNDAIKVHRWVVKPDGTKILLDDTLTATTDMATNVSFKNPTEIDGDAYIASHMLVNDPNVPVLNTAQLLELIADPTGLINDYQTISNAYLVANPPDITQNNPINVYYLVNDGGKLINNFNKNGKHESTEVIGAVDQTIAQLKQPTLLRNGAEYKKLEMGTGTIRDTDSIFDTTEWLELKSSYISDNITDGEIDATLSLGQNIYTRYNVKEMKIIEIYVNSGGVLLNRVIRYEDCPDNKIQTPGNKDGHNIKSETLHDTYLSDSITAPPVGGITIAPSSPLTVDPLKDETIVVVYEDTGALPILGKIPKDYLSKNFTLPGGGYSSQGNEAPHPKASYTHFAYSHTTGTPPNTSSCRHDCTVSFSVSDFKIETSFNKTSPSETVPTSNKYSIFGLSDYLLHLGASNFNPWNKSMTSNSKSVSVSPYFSILSHRSAADVGGNNPTLAEYMNNKNQSWVTYSADRGITWNVDKIPTMSGYSADGGTFNISFTIPWGSSDILSTFSFIVKENHSYSGHTDTETLTSNTPTTTGSGRKGLIQAETTYYGGVKDKLDRVSEASVNGSTMIFKQSPETGIKFYPTYSMKAETFRNATPLTVYPLSNKEREYTPQDVFTAKLDESSLQTQVSSTWSKDKADVGTQTMKAGYTWKASDADDSIKMEFVSYIHVPDSRYVSSTGGKDMASAIATHNAFINNYLAMGADGTSLKVYSNVPGNFNPNMPDNLKVPVSNPKTDVAKLVIPELNITYTLPTPTTVSYRLGTASGAKSDYAVGTTSVPAAVEALTKSNARLADTLETGTGYNNWYKEEFEGIEVIVLTSVVTVKNLSSTLVPTYAYLSDNLETSAVNSYGKTYPVSGAGYPTAIPNGKYGVGYALVPKKLNIYNTELTAPKAILYTPQAFNIRGSMFNDKQ